MTLLRTLAIHRLVPRSRVGFADTLGACVSSMLLGLGLLSGCATSKTSNTARTASEQLLISSAIDRSISQVRFSDFDGYNVFINEKYFESVDKNYVIGSLRHGILKNGGAIVGSAEEADVVMEVRSGGIGTDTQESFVGIPALGVPGLPIELPEIKVASRNTQMGTAKIGVVCYDAKTGKALGDGGGSTALTHNNDTYVLGVGPFRSGTVRKQRENAVGFTGVGGSMFATPVTARARQPIAMVDRAAVNPLLGLPFEPTEEIATGPKDQMRK